MENEPSRENFPFSHWTTIEEQILQKKIGQARFRPPGHQNDMGKNSKSSKNIYSQRPGNKKSKSLPQLRRNSYENVKILRKFAFQILQKWAGKEGSTALAVLKCFVLILVFEFSVATRNFHHVPCKSHIQYKYLDISWTYGNAESTNILQNLQMLCRMYPSIVLSLS